MFIRETQHLQSWVFHSIRRNNLTKGYRKRNDIKHNKNLRGFVEKLEFFHSPSWDVKRLKGRDLEVNKKTKTGHAKDTSPSFLCTVSRLTENKVKIFNMIEKWKYYFFPRPSHSCKCWLGDFVDFQRELATPKGIHQFNRSLNYLVVDGKRHAVSLNIVRLCH